MRKIITLFERNYETDRLVRDQVVPGAEWVVAGEGVATLKLDGISVLVRYEDARPLYEVQARGYRRYELKPGKTAPPKWEACEEVDPVTGKQQGWVPLDIMDPNDKYLWEALSDFSQKMQGHPLAVVGWEVTCEFLGPKSQGNVENVPAHILLPHAWAPQIPDAPRDFAGLKAFFEQNPDYEGIVWHHPDGRMVKIKGRDFGVKRQRANGVLQVQPPQPA